VNHQIEDCAVVDVPAGRRPQPFALQRDYLLVGQDVRQRPHRGVEPLDVADLQNPVVLLGQSDEFAAVGQRPDERLLDEHVRPRRETFPGDLVVKLRRHGNGDGVGRLEELAPLQRTRPVLGRHLGRLLVVDVAHPGEFDVRQRPVHAGVVPPHASDPDDAGDDVGVLTHHISSIFRVL
jgi:hypothetical protein